MPVVDLDLTPTGMHETTVEGKTFTLTSPAAFRGEICDFYSCSFFEESTHKPAGTAWERILEDDEGTEYRSYLKVATAPSDSDLVENEAKILTHLYPTDAKDEAFYRYFPRLLGSFQLRARGITRQANILAVAEGYVSFADILKAYPDGIDFRDAVWMYRRLLEGLGFVHSRGVVHGAILPCHVLIHPQTHGAKIIDWSYAVQGQHPIRAMSAAHLAFYAPEVRARRNATSVIDIYMAAKCFIALVGGDVAKNEMPASVPAEIKEFFARCLADLRPHDAWDLYDQFDELLRRVVGKRKYRPFVMPTPNNV